jgi:hypothetical protein
MTKQVRRYENCRRKKCAARKNPATNENKYHEMKCKKVNAKIQTKALKGENSDNEISQTKTLKPPD